MPLRPIYYDTETTGLSPQQERVIEIAAYDPVRDRTFVQLIHPGKPIPPETTAVHKITDEMVAGSPDFSRVAPDFINFCEGDVVLIAHNNDTFDQLFLKHEFLRLNLEIPTSWQFLDSLKWARRYRPDLPRHTLQFLREIYGVPANNAHRALDDVVVLHKVFCSMIDDLPLERVMELLKRKQEIKVMPFGKYQGQALAAVPKDYIKWLADSGALDKPENQFLKEALQKLV